MSPRALAATLVLLLSSAAASAAPAVDLYNQGIAKKKTGDLVGAEERFRACLTEDPKFARCHFSLGVLLKNKNDLGGAVDHFRRAVAEAPTWGQARLSLGFALMKQDRPELAQPELEAALADPKLDSHDRAEAHNALGVLHRQAKRWKEAVLAFDAAITLEPGNAHFHRHKALALEQLDDLAGMEREAKRATELAPNDAQTWITLAIAQARQKRPGDALNAWRKATETDPKSARAWYGRGEAAESNGNRDEAKQAFERFIELAPPNETQDTRARLKRL